jgi:F0F1-type ATP synthase assembly protein I
LSPLHDTKWIDFPFHGSVYFLHFSGEKMSDSRKEIMKLLGDFSTIGLTLAASIFVGVGIGYFLDHKVFKGRTAPWLTLIFLGFGIAAGFKNLYMLTKRKDL